MKFFLIAVFAITMSTTAAYSNEFALTDMEQGSPVIDTEVVNGTVTECSWHTTSKSTTSEVGGYWGTAAASASESSSDYIETQKHYTANVFDPRSSAPLSICGLTVGEATYYTYKNGVLDGDYSYQATYYGGNTKSVHTVKGKYKNNLRDGLWIDDDLLDCGGLADTCFDWLNSSYHKITSTTYKDGKAVSKSVKE